MKNQMLVDKDSLVFEKYADSMFELRHMVFKEKLNWEVDSTENKEIDDYDNAEDVNYVLVTDQKEKVLGCMRLLPTTGPYMLKNTFPQLAKKVALPQKKEVWEISRFAVDHTQGEKHKLTSFGQTTVMLAKGMCDFAKENNIHSYVGVTTTYVERLIRNLGLSCHRIGDVEYIDKLPVIAIEIIMDEKGFESVERRLKTE